MASSANVKRKAENCLPEQPPYKAKSLTRRKPLIDIENNIDNTEAQKHDGFSIKQVAEAVRTEKSAIRMLKVSDYTNSGSEQNSDGIDADVTLVMDEASGALSDEKLERAESKADLPVKCDTFESELPLSRMMLVHRSALVHEVVPTVYQENRRLKAVIWVLEEALAVERTRVKQLRTKLAENHV